MMDHDEIASMLLARLFKEVENFTASSVVDSDPKGDEIWNRFLEQLKDSKPSTANSSKSGTKAASAGQ
jgi:hypothetical protein